MNTATANLIKIMRERVDSLEAEGNLAEALHAASAWVEKCQQALDSDYETIDEFVDALQKRCELLLQAEDYGGAADDALQAIDQLDGRIDRIAQIGHLYSLLGSAEEMRGDEGATIQAWEKGIEFFGAHDPPLVMDIAALSNNLGFVTKASGDLGLAEDHFLRSLEIMHEELGEKHEETAAVSSNLGAVYFASGYYEQAREMNMIALETRRSVLGEDHPDTSQSHNNLALSLLKTGDRAWAKRHFEKALMGFEKKVPEYGRHLDAVAENYCDYLREEGDETLAEEISQRVGALLEI